MKKIITLIYGLLSVVLTIDAEEALSWSSFSVYETGSTPQGTWTSETRTFSVTANYGGAQIWYGADKSAYDVLVIEVKSATGKFQLNIESKPSSGDNTKVTEDIVPSSEPQYLIMSLDANKSNLQKVEVKLNDNYAEGKSTIVLGDAYFMTNSEVANMARKKTLDLNNLSNGWDSSYDSSTKEISFNDEWKGRGWNIEAALTGYDKVVIDFAEPLPYSIRVMVEYNGTYTKGSETKHYSAYADAEAKSTSVCIPINTAENYNTSINQIYIQNKANPDSKKVKLKRAYIANNHFYGLDEAVNPDYLTTTYYTTGTGGDASNTRTFNHVAKVDLTRTLKVGWNTICLPFALTSDQVTTYFGSGAKVYEYTSSDASAVTVTQVSEMMAGKPYLLKMDEAKNSITFTGVNVTATTPDASTVFKGNFTAAMDMQDKYGVTGNVIKKGASGATLKAFAGYFDFGSGAPAFFDINDGQAAGISTIDLDAKHADDTECFYNLAGQRVNQPARGIFVKNGKKYIIK